MRIIAHLLQLACPLSPGFVISISNPPWPELLIRDTQQLGPNRLRAISVAHQCEHHGRTVRAPEMLFEVEPGKKGFILTPYCLRDESMGSEEHSVYLKDGRICVNYQLQSDHMQFVRGWNTCLEQQGYVAAFHRSAFVQQLREAFDAEISAGSVQPPEQLRQLLERALLALGNRIPARPV